MITLEHLNAIAASDPLALTARVREFTIGNRTFHWNETPHVMGVVNLSPDSWYRESVCLTADHAIRRGCELAAQGADLVDIGAESTLAHAERVSDTDQVRTLLPVIRALSDRNIPVSIETYHVRAARECLEAGASVVNLTGPPENGDDIYRVIAEHDAAVILCYVQGANPRDVGDFDWNEDPIPSMREYFLRRLDAARGVGISRILIDPGLGFYYPNLKDSARRVRHQMNVFLNTFRLLPLGFPICHALPHAFEYFGPEVRSAEPFFAVLASLGRTHLFRTHEVPRVRAVLNALRA